MIFSSSTKFELVQFLQLKLYFTFSIGNNFKMKYPWFYGVVFQIESFIHVFLLLFSFSWS